MTRNRTDLFVYIATAVVFIAVVAAVITGGALHVFRP